MSQQLLSWEWLLACMRLFTELMYFYNLKLHLGNREI
jgi:hypothetical protein